MNEMKCGSEAPERWPVQDQRLVPPVSVVIPTFNRADSILSAVRSVLLQCLACDEVIVVDDGSTDGTEGVLSVVREEITYLKVPNGGAGRARNVGVDRAKNDLIAFLDSDDGWRPNKLALQRALFQERPELVLCTTNLSFRYPMGASVGERRPIPFPDPGFLERMMGPGTKFSGICPLPAGVPDFDVFIGDLYRAHLQVPCILADTVMINRILADEALFFPEDLPYSEDYECFGRVAGKGTSAFLDWDGADMYMDFWPQMSHESDTTKLGATLKVIERVWGLDRAFLSHYGDEYRERVHRLRRLLVWLLLNDGRMMEARRELGGLEGAPFGYRLLSRLPPAVASRLVWRFYSRDWA